MKSRNLQIKGSCSFPNSTYIEPISVRNVCPVLLHRFPMSLEFFNHSPPNSFFKLFQHIVSVTVNISVMSFIMPVEKCHPWNASWVFQASTRPLPSTGFIGRHLCWMVWFP